MIYMLDTTAFSAAMRNEEEILDFMRAHRPGEIVTAPPVEAEIEYGLHRLEPGSRKYTLLTEQKERLFTLIRVLPWNREASVSYGKMKAGLEKMGIPLDDFDIAIAAVAASHGAMVVTANSVHFGRIEGIRSIHWK